MFIQDEGCPFDALTLKEKIKGEFTKARLIPKTNLEDFLSVSISCMELENGGGNTYGHVISSDIRFGSILNGDQLVVEPNNRGGLMSGGARSSSNDFYFNVIKNQISDALVTHIDNSIIKREASSNDIIALMALRSEENANMVVADLRNRGYRAFIKSEDTFFSVLIEVDSVHLNTEKVITELQKITGSKGKVLE
ncbi:MULTISPECIES: SPOR domain-containing protein [Vibrio]|uniref:SPOR domain-containing protein n=1 Tax=Vibrio TaxID=662 RepID=UPI0013D9A9A9|nr:MULTISPECIES: hypothetical protein [Vibrio]